MCNFSCQLSVVFLLCLLTTSKTRPHKLCACLNNHYSHLILYFVELYTYGSLQVKTLHNCSGVVLIWVLKAYENHGKLHVDCACAALSTHSLPRVARATWSLEFPQFWVLNLARGHYSYLGYCPKACFPYSYYPTHIFSQIVRVWAQDREWRLPESFL